MAQPEHIDIGMAADTAHRQRRAFVVVGMLALVHAVFVWGYTGLFWGEYGQWLEEVSRFAHGQTPYRDFSWDSPPLALWIIGGVARLTGTSLAAINATTTVLYLLIIALFLYLLKRLTPQLVLPIALPAFLCATAYSSRYGAPLPMGSTSPAVLVGFLCLLGSTAFVLPAVDRMSRGAAIMAGILGGLALLSKQDYWLSAPYALLAGTLLMSRRRAAMDLLLTPVAACVVTVALGVTAAIWRAGLVPFLRMLIGPDDIVELAVRIMPSLERLTVDIAATAALGLIAVTALWLCLAIRDSRAALWAGSLAFVLLAATAVHLGMSVSIGRGVIARGPAPLPTIAEEMMWLGLESGRSLLSSALAFFDERLQAHLFPALMPPILLTVLLARWRSWYDRMIANRLALLLGLCVVARLHRGFEGANWYNVLLELPSFALFLQLICGPEAQKAARTVRAALSVIILLGLYSHVRMGRGPLTATGSFPVTMTHAGPVRWAPLPARIYRDADSIVGALDTTGTRGLVAFGASGGWNYFLGRTNPAPFSGGIESGPFPLATVLGRIRSADPPVILLDNRYALRPTPGPISTPLRWEPEPRPNRYTRRDREPFEALTRDCFSTATDSAAGPTTVWDCARRPDATVRRPGTTR